MTPDTGLQRRRYSPRRMAAEIDGDGQPRDMRRIHLDVHAKRGDASAETLGTNAQFIDAFEQLAFELPDISARAVNVERPQHGLFREQGGAFERATDAYADDDRRTRVRTRAIDGVDHELRNRCDAVGWNEHLQRAH